MPLVREEIAVEKSFVSKTKETLLGKVVST